MDMTVYTYTHICMYIFTSRYTHTHTYTYSYIYVKSQRERERKIDLKELDHAIVEAGKSKVCRAVMQARKPGKSWCCSLSLKGLCWQNFFFEGGQSFSFKAFN